MRQSSKQILTIAVALAAFLFALGALDHPARAGAVATAFVTDPLTGVAIDGFDPVSYFAEPEPARGDPSYAYDWGGVTWYFVSAANRDVFTRAPNVYAPQYGGHCAMSLARRYLSDGNPSIYLVARGRLYLFYSSGNREAFQLSAGPALEAAEANWPEFGRELSTR